MRITPELESIVICFVLEGRWSIATIARELGLSPRTVRRVIDRWCHELVEPRGDTDVVESGRER